MLSESNLMLMALGSAVILLTPGPTNTLLAAAGLQHGFRRAALLPLAEFFGYLIAITFWGRFMAGVAHVLPWLGTLVRVACSLYIAWLAVAMWRASGFGSADAGTVGVRTLFVATLLNPKAILFASTIFPASAFQDRGAYLEAMAVFAALVLPVGCLWIGFGASVGARRVRWLRPHHVLRAASVVLGSFSAWIVLSVIR